MKLLINTNLMSFIMIYIIRSAVIHTIGQDSCGILTVIPGDERDWITANNYIILSFNVLDNYIILLFNVLWELLKAASFCKFANADSFNPEMIYS